MIASRRISEESGIALITVLLASLVLTVLVATGLNYAMSGQNQARGDQDWNASLSSGEAGVDDYLYRLNQDSGYWQYSATNPPSDGNKAFEEFVPVPGPNNEGKFKYTADVTNLNDQGIIRLTATGKIRGKERSISAVLRRRGFLDYLYFTEYEAVDPEFYSGDPFDKQTAEVECAHHYYDTWTDPGGNPRVGRHANCRDIVFIWEDVLDGPAHSNDAWAIYGKPGSDGPFFNGDTTTSWPDPAAKYWRDIRGGSQPVFSTHPDTTKGMFGDPIPMPPSNQTIKVHANPPGGKGCLYTGPTWIKLVNDQIEVVSPFSTVSQCSTSGTFTPGSDFNGVIYVQNVPNLPTDPNYRPLGGCSPNDSSYPLKTPKGLPISNDLNRSTYQCSKGDVFLSGQLDGRMTIASESRIIVMTEGVKYKDDPPNSDDVLGLVADDQVEIYHPVKCTSRNPASACDLLPAKDVRVDAAILAVKHSIRVQLWYTGTPRGTLTINGTLAQRYRGPVGTLTISTDPPTILSGYIKNYGYDSRLKYTSPPHFLDPVKTAWQVGVWSEI